MPINPLANLTPNQLIIIIIISIWSLIWKGFALWKSAHNQHRTIFIVLLILNTAGLAEIAYLIYLHYKTKKNNVTLPAEQV